MSLRCVLGRTVILATIVTATLPGVGPRAGAATGGAGATGHGDEIITSILAASSGTRGGSQGAGNHEVPVCRTHVLSDRQIVYLLHVAANMPELLEASFISALDDYTNTTVTATDLPRHSTTTTSAPAPGPPSTVLPTTTVPVVTEPTVTYWELAVRICDGVADTMSVRPRTVHTAVLGASAVAGARLRHSTRLPPPVLQMSPPPRRGPFGVVTSTIVGEPVFFSVDPPAPVRETVPFAGRTVEVEATPHHLELFGGEPDPEHRVTRCNGLGVRYDPESVLPVRRQASAPEACVLVFERATGSPRRDTWLGYGALEWSGRYRVDGGPWRPLDGLFSTSVFAISVGEVDTVIANDG